MDGVFLGSSSSEHDRPKHDLHDRPLLTAAVDLTPTPLSSTDRIISTGVKKKRRKLAFYTESTPRNWHVSTVVFPSLCLNCVPNKIKHWVFHIMKSYLALPMGALSEDL